MLPGELQWVNDSLESRVGPAALTITAGAITDLFIDPAGSAIKDNAPVGLFVPPDDSFALSARVKVGFASTFDAGVLQVRERAEVWAKLCFEYSPQRQPMVVSVVTRDLSDDCNSTVIEGDTVYLRVSRRPPVFAFHYSRDGHVWHMVRYFTLGKLEHLRVGFSSQSPTGQRCTAVFSEILYRPGAVKDFRSGE